MSRASVFLTLGMGTLGLFGGAVYANAQSNPALWYAWIVTNRWIVPTLLAFTCLFLFLAIREWRRFQEFFWSNLSRVIPKPVEPPSDACAKSPELRLHYRKLGEDAEILTFALRQGAPVTVRKVGPLVSEETYRAEQDIILLQSAIPDVEAGRPVDCQVLAVRNAATHDSISLADALEAGGPMTMDYVSVEYADAEHNEFASRFVLHKNQDGSIVPRTEAESSPSPRDLSELRRKLRLLKECVPALTFAGELRVLADEARSLVELLQQQQAEARGLSDQGALAVFQHPLSMKIFRETPESAPWTWGMKSLWKFQSLYREHQARVLRYSPPITSRASEQGIPDDLADFGRVIQMITEHEQNLTELARAQQLPYAH